MMNMHTNSERPQRRAPRCGNCGGEGHNRRTCPSLDARLARRTEDLNEERRDAMDRSRWEREAARIQHEQRIRRERHQREREAREREERRREQERLHSERLREQQRLSEADLEELHRRFEERDGQIEQQQQEERRHQQRQREQQQAQMQRTPANQQVINNLVRQAQDDQRTITLAMRMARRMARRLPRPERGPIQQEDEREQIDLKVVADMPTLRDTAVEMDECPICMETLGETGKFVLKCGHCICQGCFLQQVLRATAIKKTNDCACPVCRVNYIK